MNKSKGMKQKLTIRLSKNKANILFSSEYFHRENFITPIAPIQMQIKHLICLN